MMKPSPSIPVQITDIIQTTEEAVLVELSGRRVFWVPRSAVEFYPGHVLLPMWLVKKINNKVFLHET